MIKNFLNGLNEYFLYFWAAFCIAIMLNYMGNVDSYVALEDINVLNSQISEMQISLKNTEKHIEELSFSYKDSILLDLNIDKTIESLRYETNKYKMLAGYQDMYGEGVIVIIDDADRSLLAEENPANLIVHDLDIRLLVNELQNAGAEAISINGQRLVQGITRIQCVGPTIKINGIKQSQPYIINAIGDRFELYNALNAYNSIATRLRQAGLKLNVETKKYIEIKGYDLYKI